MPTEKKHFDADVAQLIKLVTHSIYSNTDIFLRELISNANDACQKARLKSLQDPSYLGDETELQITIDIDTDKKILEITDTGIGMTRDEVIENIGTIAKSWTKAFLEALEKENKKKTKDKNTGLIGQFGIWFYSAFMVANKVELETKAKGAKAVLRRSTGDGNYELDTSSKKTRGTTVRLFLSSENDNEAYADYHRIKGLIKKHSNYVPVPIFMPKLKDGKPTKEYEQVNEMQSLRTKQKSSIKKEEYEEFYKSLTYSQEGPLDTIHITIEWAVNFKALLFIPKQPGMMEQMQWWGIDDKEYGPSLYVQNILIMDNAKELLPVWLRFVKGVVETPDLPLNVSRELLQSSAVLAKIQKTLVKEILKSLHYVADTQNDAYQEFYGHYARYLKEGIYYDIENAENIAGLLRYYSWKNKGAITFDEYIKKLSRDDLLERPKKTSKKNKKKTKNDDNENENNNAQDDDNTSEPSELSKNIYYLTWKSLVALEQSPYLEQFKEHDIDVLLMDDPLDEYVVGALPSYKDHKLLSASSPEVQLWDKKKQEKAKKEQEEKTKTHQKFLDHFKKQIGEDKLENIQFTNKIGNNLAVLVTPSGQASPQMERIMKAMGQSIPPIKRILQINDKHPLVSKAIALFNKDPKSPEATKILQYIYDQSFLLEWWELEDMAGFIKRVNEMIG